MSADGRFVAFDSAAHNLTRNSPNGGMFVRELDVPTSRPPTPIHQGSCASPPADLPPLAHRTTFMCQGLADPVFPGRSLSARKR
jgi:hypothetical protein